MRQYRLDNLDADKDRKKQWRQDNPERYNKTSRDWRQNNLDKRRTYERKWREHNLEKERMRSRIIQAQRRAATGSYTQDDLIEIQRMQRNRCAICRKKITKFHVDHIKPLSKGGTSNRRNLQLLCQPCNQKKFNHDLTDYMRRLGRLL